METATEIQPTSQTATDDIAIRVSGLSKRYLIGSEKKGSLEETLSGLIGTKNNRKEEFWALQDINFEVEKGEVIGIIGKNGAGKSTLLKILSRITQPTTGKIEINGRVASLLEVGTGFHPELTGRENIYLNGTILGMSRQEVKAKFEEIVEFSGVRKFIDTPVKHYSSGMYVRLAFAVAAHLEPETLIIDEVLAVGDAEFQKKCLGKMKEVAGHGRTVLFVSHNMAAVQHLCQKSIYLKDGKIMNHGKTSDVVNSYLNSDSKNKEFNFDLFSNSKLFAELSFLNDSDLKTHFFISGKALKIGVSLVPNRDYEDVAIRVLVKDNKGNNIFMCNNKLLNCLIDIKKGEKKDLLFKIPKLPLPKGKYSVDILGASKHSGIIEEHENIMGFEVEDGDFFNTGITPILKEGIYVDHSVRFIKI